MQITDPSVFGRNLHLWEQATRCRELMVSEFLRKIGDTGGTFREGIDHIRPMIYRE